MIKRGYLKPAISIDLIGKKKFWLGIVLGFAYALILSYFFNYSRESLRLTTFFGDPYILSPKDFRKYDLFFSSLAASIGFGIVIVCWFHGSNKYILKRLRKRFAVTNTLFVSIVALMIVSRFGSILPIILYRSGFDNQLVIHEEFKLLLILTPLFVFFANWNGVRAFLQTRNWILISFVLYCLITLFIYKTTSVDKNALNSQYYNNNKERFDFIEQEFRKAARMDITFPEGTKSTLQKRYAQGTHDLVLELKDAFGSGRKLTKDTLILEKIVIHNMNQHGKYYFRYKDEINKNWSYALPEDIYDHIKMSEIGSPEMELLFEILYEEASIFIADDYNWEYSDSYSTYERERIFFRRHILRSTNTILSRLEQVLEKLKSEKKYEQYHYLLRDIQYTDKRGWQLHQELNLQ